MSALIAAGSFAAGLFGSLTGLGGGIIIVPLLTLGFGVHLHYAIGASLVSIIATSSGAASPYVGQGFANIRVGMLLEVATVTGALTGAFLVSSIPVNIIAIIFSVVLLFTVWQSFTRSALQVALTSDALAERLHLPSTYPAPGGDQAYEVTGVPLGFGLMYIAGILSALLGIGSGIMKVLAMDRVMKLPFKVSTTTSTFMIGVTAAASSGVYLSKGYIDPVLAFPVMLGVLGGAFAGARILPWARTQWLRVAFTVIVVVIALQMLYKGIRGTM